METSNLGSVLDFVQQINLSKIMLFILSIFCLVFIVKGIKFLSYRLYEKLPNKRLLILQIETVLSFTTYVGGAVYLFFSIISPTREIMLAVGGSLAVALGFALKDVAGSIVAGLILLFDRPFQVGDRVQFQDIYGEIKSIGLRAVRLITLDDSVVTIPNSKFITDYVSSGNAGSLDMMIETSFHVHPKEDLEPLKKDIYEVVCTSRFAFLDKPIIISAQEELFARQLVIKISVKAYVLDVRYEEDFRTDIVMRVGKLFNKKGIDRLAS